MVSLRIIIKKIIPSSVFRKIEPLGHLIESIIVNIRYGFPARKMHVIGVTGTNGKTTTSFLIQNMLHQAGYKVGLLTTVAYGAGDDIQPQLEHITTAQVGILMKRLRDFRRSDVDWVVLEVSSHALAQYRTWGVPYEIAVVTNVTYEHLDYHGTFNNYLEAKRRLFKIANKHGLRFGVINAEDENADVFIKSIKNHTTYGIDSGDIVANNVKLTADHSTFKVRAGKDSYNLRINIPGKFNVSNSLAAVAVGRKLGLTKQQIEKGIASLTGVEGRMSVVDEGQEFKVIIDFAGTPDAFDKFFDTIRPATKGRLITVFGSPSQRDEAKRPVQGEIAGKNTDILIVTEEDDRVEPGEKIMSEIAAGAIKAGMILDQNLFKIGNREDAIGFALAQAKNKDDVVAILGKGHEKTIERAEGVYTWDEIEVVRSAINKILDQSKAS